MISIFACESQPIVVEGLARVFESQQEFTLRGVAFSVGEATDGVRTHRPDVVLVDHLFGMKSILQFIGDCKAMSPESQAVLWVTDLAESESFRLLQMGVRGVLKKSVPMSTMFECFRAVASGHLWVENAAATAIPAIVHRRSAPRLTPREREIVLHVCRGLKNKEIATNLAITPGTVKVHLMHIFEKTGVKDRFELAVHGRKLAGDVE